jgi:putative transposase
MAQFAGVCRLIWNLALEQRRDHWRRYQAMTGNTLTYVTQARELTALRAEVDFVRAVHVTPQQRTLKAMDAACRRAWKGLGGYPKPKKKGVGDAFSFAGREVAVETINRRWGRVRLPKIGWVRFRLTRPINGAIREATITRTALGWQVSIGCLLNGATSDNGLTVGIDRGVSVPLMLSDGTAYRLPPEIERHERAIRRAQRTASRRKRGSRRWAKAQRRVAALKARQARARKHWAHETTTAIARRYGGVVVERLRTRNMTRSARRTIEAPGNRVAQKRGLNRAILNVGWHQIETMLAYKIARLVKVDPAYSSQTCASCGTVDSRSRESQAVFVCTACGHRDNADRNAAVVILHRGSTPGVEATGCGACEAQTVQAA